MILVFDIGGTWMRTAAARDRALGEPYILSTPQDPAEGVAQLISELKARSSGEQVTAVAGGIAGFIDAGTVRHSPNLPAWKDVPLAKKISEAFPGASVTVLNDAVVECVGEARRGAGAGKRVVAYLTVGTGIGGACTVDGVPEAVASGFEPGEQIIDQTSGATLEALVSGKSIRKHYGVSAKELAPDALDAVAKVLAIGAHNSIVHWSPDVLVFGGAVVRDVPVLVPAIERALATIPAGFPYPPLVAATLGNESGLVGSLELALKEG